MEYLIGIVIGFIMGSVGPKLVNKLVNLLNYLSHKGRGFLIQRDC